MTRENKLALVIGFALILFVGILISDHFSVARNQESANLALTVDDPLSRSGNNNPELIDYQLLTAPARIENSETRRDSVTRQQSKNEAMTVYMGTTRQTQPRAIGLDDTQAASLPFTYHEVRAGESLTSIASRYFGDGALALELASFNKLTNPNALRAGVRIKIPTQVDPLIRGELTPTPAPNRTPTTTPRAEPKQPPREPKYATYTIKSGDVLSKISQKLLGTSKRYLELYELNKDVMSSPNRLIPGTIIRIPRD